MRLNYRYSTLIISTAALAIASQAQGQKYPEPDAMTPAATEIWLPQPTIVTPAPATTSAAPPSDAIVLLDANKGMSAWQSVAGGDAPWTLSPEGVMKVKASAGDIRTRESFGDCQLHIEWQSPSKVEGQSQGRGNSGLFLQGLYEVQILDNYDNETYANGQAASIYKQAPPLVNAMRRPGEWNSYDIIYTAPRFKENGTLFTPARITVLHNGVLVQNNTTIQGPTLYVGVPRYGAPHGDAPITLQDHSNPVSFRNIWIRKL